MDFSACDSFNLTMCLCRIGNDDGEGGTVLWIISVGQVAAALATTQPAAILIFQDIVNYHHNTNGGRISSPLKGVHCHLYFV